MTICVAFHSTELVESQATLGVVHLGHVVLDGTEVEQADEREREEMDEWRERKHYTRDQSDVVCYWVK